MQIIVKQDLNTNSEKVLNIFYGENDSFISNWINAYLEEEIDILKNTPCEESVKSDSLDYFVELESGIYYLVKKYHLIVKGYIYNSSEKVSKRLFSIRCLQFDGINLVLEKVQSQPLWNNINSEINHRVLKQVDQDSMYNICLNMESAIKTKENWTSTELVMLQNEVTKNYKRELYSSVVKKMKKFEKKQTKKLYQQKANIIPCKTIIAEGDQIRGTGGIMPDISSFAGKSCALEYHIINYKEKFD